MANLPRAVAYIVADDNELDGIRGILARYCEEFGLKLVSVLIDTPSAVNVQLLDRPQGSMLFPTIKKLRAKNLIIRSVFEVFSDHVDAAKQLRMAVGQWRKRHVHILRGNVILRDNFDPSTKLYLTALQEAADIAKRNHSLRQKTLSAQRKEVGRVYGPSPYGYKAFEDHNVEVPEEQKVIRRMKTEREAGASFQQIADRLNAEGVPTKKGGRWFPRTVSRIVGNPEVRQSPRNGGDIGGARIYAYTKDVEGRVTPYIEFSTNPPAGVNCRMQTAPIDALSSQTTGDLNRLLGVSVSVAYGRSVSTHVSRYQQYRYENLNILRQWLSDHFGVLTAFSSIDLMNYGGAPVDKDVKGEVTRRIVTKVSQLTGADYCTLYQYDYETASLDTVFSLGDRPKKLAPIMRNAGRDPDQRKLSLAYRALRNTQFCLSYDPGTTCAVPPDQPLLTIPPSLPSGRSGIAAPLSVFCRSWSVLEVIGRRAFQLQMVNQRVVEDMSEIIAPFYYNQLLLTAIHKFNEIVADADGGIDLKMNRVCGQIANIFLCESVVLWKIDDSTPGETKYVGAGWHNRPDLDKINRGDICFHIANSDRWTVHTMNNRDLNWWQEQIGRHPLIGNWASIPFTRELSNLGRRLMCIIPIRDAAGTNIASISLYSNSSEYYDKRWERFAIFISRYLAVLLKTVSTRQEWESNARQIIAHEMKGSVGSICDIVQRLDGTIRSLLKGGDARAERYDLWLRDLEEHSKNLQKSMSILTSENFLRDATLPQDIVIKQEKDRMNDVSEINVRDEFNAVFRTHKAAQAAKLIEVSTVFFPDCIIKINAQNFAHVLINIYSNAIKPSPRGQSIISSLSVSRLGVTLPIKNLGEPLDTEESQRIFSHGFRGSNSRNIDGRGIGLYQVKKICELYGMGIRHFQMPSEREGALIWHSFALTIPNQYIIWQPTDGRD